MNSPADWVWHAYGGARPRGQALRSVYLRGGIMRPQREGERKMIVGLASAMFIALFAWGAQYFGWSDPEGKVQLALVTSFILGIVGGYKAKGD
jgi:hypothetical protein